MKAAILCLIGALVGVYLVGAWGAPEHKLLALLVVATPLILAIVSLARAENAGLGKPIHGTIGNAPIGHVDILKIFRFGGYGTIGVVVRNPSGPSASDRLYLELDEWLFDPACKEGHVAILRYTRPHEEGSLRLTLVVPPPPQSTEPIDFTEDEPAELPRADKPHATAPKVP